MNKVIAVFANGGTMTTTQTALWQYDYGQILVIQGVQLPTAYEVHFCNSKDSTTITSIGDADGVVIPDQFLKNGEVIYAYVYLHTGDSDGETEYKITIPVMDRAEPTDIEPTPAQESTIGQLISALNDAVDTAEEAASKGPIIQNGYWFIWDSTAEEYVTTDVKAAGIDGEDGNIIWWTTDHVTASGDNAGIQRRKLHGPEGLTPAVGDYVFAPSAGNEGEPTTLYVIITSTATVIMTALGRIVGPAGQDGTDGTDGQDGYSPEVTITSITGGHRVTITDEDHPSGQSFDVMDGTSGSSDYSNLTNKPSINSITLSGNKSLSDLGIQPQDFVVSVTYDSGNDAYSANKTFAQIKAARQAGKNVVVTYGNTNEVYRLAVWIDDPLEFAVFAFNQGTSVNQIMIDETNLVSRSVGSAYSKPSGGIPKTDLASAVQTSLGKADTALQPGDVAEPYFVTYNTSDMTTWTCDKTFAQITAAMAAGKQVVLVCSVGGTPISQNCDTLLFNSGGQYYIEFWIRYSRADWYRLTHNDDNTIDFTQSSIDYDAVGAVASDQGVSHAGEFLVVDDYGNVTTMSLSTWQGGNY